jgi:hypothetical protein
MLALSRDVSRNNGGAGGIVSAAQQPQGRRLSSVSGIPD